MYPKNLIYSQTHEWVRVDENVVTVGITNFAVKRLTDLAYIELPSLEGKVTKGYFFGTVESVKAVSDLCSPVSGKIIKVNDKLSKEPEIINQDPYGEGWMIVVEMEELSELDALMDSEEYEQFVEKENEG